ncbi:MAG: DNA methyltransferase [Armatimonadota bacterium]
MSLASELTSQDTRLALALLLGGHPCPERSRRDRGLGGRATHLARRDREAQRAALRQGHPAGGPFGTLRAGNHPTPEPVPLLEELITASCPTRGRILDPFAGSGSTLRRAQGKPSSPPSG